MAFNKIKKEEEAESIIPKLTYSQLDEITSLVKSYGNTIRVLANWGAVKIDENDRITAICDYSEQGEFTKRRYENYEPLKGVKFTTNIPYDWCSEWIRKWEIYIIIKAKEGNEIAKTLIKSPYIKI